MAGSTTAPAGAEVEPRRLPVVVRRVLLAVMRLLIGGCLVTSLCTVATLALLHSRGEQVMVVISGSMTPTFRAGDAVVVQPPRAEDLRVGTVISFHAPGDPDHLTTHRIVARQDRPEGLFLQTQGDANATPDPNLTPVGSVVGVMTGVVPPAGFWLAYFQSPEGRAVVLGLPLLLLIAGQARSTVGQLLRGGRVTTSHVPLTAAVVVVAVVSGAALAHATGAVFAEQVPNTANAFTTTAYCGTGTTYQQAVLANSPVIYYRFSETTGTSAANLGSATGAGTYTGGFTLGVPGAVACETTSTAVRLNGSTGLVVRPNGTTASTNTFTEEAWFRTTTGGGKIAGWGNVRNTASTTYDRHLYLSDTGTLYFGVNPSSKTVISSPGTYLDGRWHYVAATLGTNGMHLYVDGVEVAANTGVTTAGTAYSGYWRTGFDALTGWTAAPTNPWFTGDLDEVAFYTTTLTAAQIATHYAERRG
jgi:signal peptidase I